MVAMRAHKSMRLDMSETEGIAGNCDASSEDWSSRQLELDSP